MSVKGLVKQSLIARENRKYEKALDARRMTYAKWQELRAGEGVSASLSVSDTAQQAKLSEFILLVSSRGEIDAHALDRIERYLEEHPWVQVAYGDEDVAGDEGTAGEEKQAARGGCYSPYFKPDWSPDLLNSCFYVGSLVAVRRELLPKVSGAKHFDTDERMHVFGVEQEEFRRELIRECIRRAGGYEKREEQCKIGHIPEVLFHCRKKEVLDEFATPLSVQRAKEGEEKKKQFAGLLVKQQQEHKLSVIIPSKDHPELVRKCIEGIRNTQGTLPYEIILVDNGSNVQNRARCQMLMKSLVKEGIATNYLYRPMEFNFSAMCNWGAKEAQGDLLLFLNDDVELCEENTLELMAQKAIQPYTGAVGLKLYYPEGQRIQHAGITNLPMGPVHKLQFMADEGEYYFYYNRGSRNVLAVTAACLMVEREKFRQAGGFPEQLRIAFNDVALCFALYEQGYYNVVLNDLYAYHHESLSRGNDESEEKVRRLLQEKELLYSLHPELRGVDPYYSEHLSRVGLDTRIRPAYETAGNQAQELREVLSPTVLNGYRQDNCLLLRVEDCSADTISGYAVVLGDDNSCYDKELLLCPEETFTAQEVAQDLPVRESGMQPMYCTSIEGQYRPDLVENMPDQKNVGLCGFWFHIPINPVNPINPIKGDGEQAKGIVPAGSYRIGAVARNRVTGTKLMVFSNRCWNIK